MPNVFRLTFYQYDRDMLSLYNQVNLGFCSAQQNCFKSKGIDADFVKCIMETVVQQDKLFLQASSGKALAA